MSRLHLSRAAWLGLQALASRRGWAVEKEAPKEVDAALHAATGAEFERHYVDAMAKTMQAD